MRNFIIISFVLGAYFKVALCFPANISVYFSPNGGATEAIVSEIKHAKREIWIQAYKFTSKPIAKAVIDAKKHGVMIYVILDKSNETDQYSAATFLKNADIPVLIDYSPKIAHSKVIVIDRETIVTGSFNFTKAAEHENVENMLVIHNDLELAQKYIENFEARAKLSKVYLKNKS
jgi:phosphatidylserine/phosphatidylglycerophosphate/cardiolipin synthase-like enzyme